MASGQEPGPPYILVGKRRQSPPDGRRLSPHLIPATNKSISYGKMTGEFTHLDCIPRNASLHVHELALCIESIKVFLFLARKAEENGSLQENHLINGICYRILHNYLNV